MHRILLPVLLLVCGNYGISQNFDENALLKKLSSDPDNRVQYQDQLQKEYETFTQADFLTHLTKTQEVIEKTFSPAEKISAWRFLGKACWKKNLYAEAINFYDRSVAVAVEKGLMTEAGMSYLDLARQFRGSEMYPQALEKVYQSNAYFINANDRLNQAKTLTMAADIGYNAGNYGLAVEEIEKAITLFKEMDQAKLSRNDRAGIMSALNTSGLAYGQIGEFEKAMARYNEAEKIAFELGDKFWFGLINGNKAKIYSLRNEIESAVTSLKLDLKSSIEFRQWGSAIGSSISLAQLCMRENEWRNARRYLDMANQMMAQYSASRALEALYLKTLSGILAHENKNTEAYKALLRHNEIQDSLKLQHESATLARIKTAFDIGQTQTQIEALVAENRLREQQVDYRNIIMTCASAAILLLFILAFVIYRNYKVKKRDNYLLVERNNAIKDINEELRSYVEKLATQNQVINKMNNDLEENVKKRTYELEQANTELDLFLYGASHDIRRPITTLLGLGNLAHAMSLDKNAIHLFEKVMETATDMDRMLYKLQMIYALNRPHDINTPVSLTAVVQNCLTRFSGEIKKTGMHCEVDLKEPVLFKSEESLLGIIFQNLIENAIAFRKPDGVETACLWIRAFSWDEGVFVSIRDNGIGIENDYIHRIFDLHFRGTALSHGNGLGLYLVKKALALLKGRIEVTSEPGVGSTFTLSFDAKA